MRRRESTAPGEYFGDAPGSAVLSHRIDAAVTRLRELLEPRHSGRPNRKTPGPEELIKVARERNIAPLLCARLDVMLRSQRLRDSLTL